jgi:L-alanine-DL-glutamate epimerase-like enolase superfamily enzyme
VRIKAIETYSNRDVAVVRVRADDGSESWGQLAPYNADLSAAVLHRQVAPYALGADALDIGGLITAIPTVEDGCVSVPDGPGWGVEISPSWLERADRVVSEV